MESIRKQEFTDWELIIVDDGSTDETGMILPDLLAEVEQPIQCFRQENQGAYVARNMGLEHATGRYIAFFDSDDFWLPHHVKDCVDALDSNPDVDWVYGACCIKEEATNRTIDPNSFFINGVPRPFMQLRVREKGQVRVIDDSAVVQCAISNGLYCGLQNSVLRRALFDGVRFDTTRNGDDQLFVIRCLSERRTFAYFPNVHVIYCVHDSNSSAAGSDDDIDHRSRVLRSLAAGFERLLVERQWAPKEQHAIRKRLQREYFWKLGYATLLRSGQYQEAMRMFRIGLSYWPWDWRCWKTYVVSSLRNFLGLAAF